MILAKEVIQLLIEAKKKRTFRHREIDSGDTPSGSSTPWSVDKMGSPTAAKSPEDGL